ncbi:MAG: hypothetical protein GX045_00715 [Clostridiaceae bacterium]|nr:hypothetical protein [Clostridiaceae bacterium]
MTGIAILVPVQLFPAKIKVSVSFMREHLPVNKNNHSTSYVVYIKEVTSFGLFVIEKCFPEKRV